MTREKFLDWNYAYKLPNGKNLGEFIGDILEYVQDRIKNDVNIDIHVENLKKIILEESKNFRECLATLQKYFNEIYGDIRLFYYVARQRQSNFCVFRAQKRPRHQHNLCIYKDFNGDFYILTNPAKFFNSTTKQVLF